jgi:hypothetical protein
VRQWGSSGAGNGLFYYPSGVAVQANGDVVVADSNNNRVQVFTPSGTYVGQWGTLGVGNGQFEYPYGIATDGSGNIFVVDSYNERIQKFLYQNTITVTNPNGGNNWLLGSTQTITWSYTGSPGPKVKIELLKGTAVNRVINASTSIGSAGLGSYSWKILLTQTVGTDYKIRINSTSNAAYTDKSNANFTISGF